MSHSAQTRTMAAKVEKIREAGRLRDQDGLTWGAVAARLGVNERTARRYYADFLESRPSVSLREIDPDAVAARVVAAHEAALAEAERLLTSADNSAARIGAARSCASIGSSLLAVLAQLGVAPTDVARARLHSDMRQFAQAVIESAGRHGVPDAALEALFGDLDDAATAAAGNGAAA